MRGSVRPSVGRSVGPSVRQPYMCEGVQFVCVYVHRVCVCEYDGGVCVPLSVSTSALSSAKMCVCARIGVYTLV